MKKTQGQANPQKTNQLLKKSSDDIYTLQKELETYGTTKNITKSIFENIN